MKLYFSRIIKRRLKALNSSSQTFADIFQLIHNKNSNLFCEQINDRVFVQKMSYWEIRRLSLALAQVFKSKYKHEKIGIKMANSYLFIVNFWAILLSGNIPVLINTEFNANQFNKVINDLEIREVITLEVAKAMHSEIKHSLPPYDFDYRGASDEIILISTGTTGNMHYSSYSGKRVAAFINKTPYIVDKIPQMIATKDIKHLVVLPLYHIFGLFTVYFWFAFFGMKFLFLDDIFNDPLGNVRRYNVSHIFAVPAFFKVVAAKISKEVAKEKMEKKFNEGIEQSIAFQSKFPNISRNIIRRKFDRVVQKSFGYNVKMLIAGGAALDRDTLRIINGIGYDLITGYGATEIGITSINLSNNIEGRLLANIGSPLPNVTYQINDNGVLVVKADTQADNIGESFITNDLCSEENGVYNFVARNDEIVTLENGENYNLNELQTVNYGFNIIEQYCFLPLQKDIIFLFTIHQMSEGTIALAKEEVRNNKTLQNYRVTKIMVTEKPLRSGLKMINYREILKAIIEGTLKVIDLAQLDQSPTLLPSEIATTKLQIERIIKTVLEVDKPLGYDVDIFLELGVSSFDYSLVLYDLNTFFNLTSSSKINDFFASVPRSINEFDKLISEYLAEKV